MPLRNYSKKGTVEMDDSVLQDMVNRNEDCRIQDDCVIVRPSQVVNQLNGKLSEADIAKASEITQMQVRHSVIQHHLYTQCINTTCTNREKCMFRSVPNGNINADVMFVSKMPTQYETLIGASHTGVNGMFLSLILDKMNVPRASIYFTDFIKCCTDNLDEQSYNECIQQYFAQEIDIVKPKLIICNGLPLLRSCIKANIFPGLSEAVAYGKIYNAETHTGCRVNVMSIYDLDKVLQKTGNDYEKCKTELWGQLLTGFKSLG